MASYREMQPSVRPLAQHRLSMSGSATAVPGRQSSHTRASSHSLLTGNLNANHRVTRRKSVNAGTNVSAIAAALRAGDGSGSPALPIASTARRATMSKSAAARAAIVGSLPSPPMGLVSQKSLADVKSQLQGSAIDDLQDLSGDEDPDNGPDARARRASDGQPLTKDGKKSNRIEVRCDTCGKSYKHGSCLTKHLWEHTPQWSYTSKLLISKHQQVQLLEAASVLVGMNGNPPDADVATPPDSTKDFASEPESASPLASGDSDQDRQSSANTTPPPLMERTLFSGNSYHTKRHSSIGGLSRSYQSAHSPGSIIGASVPNNRGLGPFGLNGGEFQPASPRYNTGKEDRDLAAAVELLSCSFGSNSGSHGTVTLPADAPPVPPVPAQYLDQATSLSSAAFINSFPRRQPESFTRGEIRRGSQDVKMEDSGDSVADDDDFDKRSRARSDEEDDGVFGRMEE